MFKKKRAYDAPYEPAGQTVIMRVSICTGEKTVFFRDRDTGDIHQVGCIHDERELHEFMEQYNLNETDIVHEW